MQIKINTIIIVKCITKFVDLNLKENYMKKISNKIQTRKNKNSKLNDNFHSVR